jgi:hypothetical protein
VECLIYPTEFPSIHTLIKKSKGPILVTEKAFPAVLTFSVENPVAGACKLAYFRRTNKPIFPDSTSIDICIKQAFYLDRATAARLLYEGPRQAEVLTTEINCSRWASALMCLVYEFMEKADKLRGKPPFSILQMRYVNIALAVANNDKRETYLLEEVVGESDGDFRKYINNTSSVPLSQTDAKRQYVGKFLSFAQHVQMVETAEHVFVSDQQGIVHFERCLQTHLMRYDTRGSHTSLGSSDHYLAVCCHFSFNVSLLTPALIRALGAGRVFADGNLAAAFTSFKDDHICNQFCKFYSILWFLDTLGFLDTLTGKLLQLFLNLLEFWRD